MRFTYAMLAEKVISVLNIVPLFLHAEEESIIQRIVRGIPDDWAPTDLCIVDHRSGSIQEAIRLPSACFYIASLEECSTGCVPDVLPGSSLMVLPSSVEPSALTDALQETFSFYNTWYDNMLNIIRRGEDWFHLLEEGHRVLGNPIILYDRSMKVLAYTRNDHTDDPVWNSTTGSGTIRVGTPNEASELLRYVARLDLYTRPFKHEGEGLSSPFYTSSILCDGVRCGVVTEVEFHHPLSTADRELLQVFTDLAALKIRSTLETSVSPDMAGHLLVRDLLDGKITSPDYLASRLFSTQWQVHRFFCLLLFSSPLPFQTDGQWRQTYSDLMRLGLNGVGSLIRKEESQLCLILSMPEEGLSPAQIEILQHFCDAHHLCCGCSNNYEDLLETRRYEVQAATALSLGHETLNFFSSLRYMQMIRRLLCSDYPQDLIHPAVLQLRQIDKNTGSEYLRTLHSLIVHFYRQTDTASALNIHRTTLLYRISKIRELTRIDLDDPQEMLHAALSLEMLKDL